MSSIAKRPQRGFNVWPGYVDALSALLMVVIFLVLIFSVTQFLLSQILSGQESELVDLQRQVSELTTQLGLEEKQNRTLTANVADLSFMVTSLTGTKETLQAKVSEMTANAHQDKAEIEQQLLMIGSLQEDIDALRRMRQELEDKVGHMAMALQSSQNAVGQLRDRSKSLEVRLADAAERTHLAQQAIEEKQIRIQALSALIGDQKQALAEERQLSANARGQMIQLKQAIATLKARLETVSRALDLAHNDKADQETEIKDLGKRLNLALAQKVNDLTAYRSEFFGRLKNVLGENPLIRVEGDRFVFQAELLFASGSAELGAEGA